MFGRRRGTRVAFPAFIWYWVAVVRTRGNDGCRQRRNLTRVAELPRQKRLPAIHGVCRRYPSGCAFSGIASLQPRRRECAARRARANLGRACYVVRLHNLSLPVLRAFEAERSGALQRCLFGRVSGRHGGNQLLASSIVAAGAAPRHVRHGLDLGSKAIEPHGPHTLQSQTAQVPSSSLVTRRRICG